LEAISVKVRKAVIPAAGLGTRFLPATKSQPKEMLPVVDKPGIQYVVEEALRAGIDDILIVTSRGKSGLEDHFDRSLELERRLEATGKERELEEIRRIATMAQVHYVRQQEALGLGHAVAMARSHVGDEPFVVMLPDEIVPEPRGDEPSLLGRMIEIAEARSASVLAVQEVPVEDVPGYGVIRHEQIDGDTTKVVDMVEKPPAAEAPSNLASRGRYVLAARVFDAIEETDAGVGGEIQITDALRTLAAEGSLFAYIHPAPIYDVGKKVDFLKATVELSLRRDDVSRPFQTYLRELMKRLD